MEPCVLQESLDSSAEVLFVNCCTSILPLSRFNAHRIRTVSYDHRSRSARFPNLSRLKNVNHRFH